jgi:hypothetical protein
MNWMLPNYYCNIEYKSIKCGCCGNEIIVNPNIRSKNGKIKPVNLDNSPHNCWELNQKGGIGYDRI